MGVAKNRPDDPGSRRRLICALVGLAFSGPLLANPVGPTVVGGTATFATAGRTLSVTNSPNAIINWQGFSIGAGEATRFIQQSAASSVLNRVVGQDPSAILGTLSSNGRVFLINPNGILFGVGSRVDVAGLIASTLNISNQDFLAGRLNFQSGAVANPIQNYGSITTPAGGQVYLIAPNVENHGVISTPQGQTILAAGKSAQLVEADVPNLRVEVTAGGEALNVGQILAEGGSAGIYAGLINQKGIVRADSASRDATGRIVFRASGRTMLEAGSVTSASGEQGGRIEVTGNEVGLTGNARVEASGREGGGTILIGGDYQGKNPEVPNARATYVGPEAVIDASAIETGDGGKVIVWADEATRVYGAISARGGTVSGNGGFVETSGHYLHVTRAPDVSAPQGSGGTWLLDPRNIEVVAGSGATNNSGAPSFTPTGDDSQIGASLINGQLDANSNVVLNTGVSGSQAGNITVNAAITKTNPNNASLTLIAANSIALNAPIDLSVGGSVTMTSFGGSIMSGFSGINIAAPSASLTAASGIGFLDWGQLRSNPNPNPIRTQVSQISLSSSGGDIHVINTGALVLSGLSHAGGDSYSNGAAVEATGAMTVGTVNVAGDVQLISGGNMSVESVTAGGYAILRAIAGAITDANGASMNVNAQHLEAAARNGINLDTHVTGGSPSYVNATNSTSGGIALRNTSSDAFIQNIHNAGGSNILSGLLTNSESTIITGGVVIHGDWGSGSAGQSSTDPANPRFTFTANGGDVKIILNSPRANNSRTDPYLYLLDANDNLITQNDDAGQGYVAMINQPSMAAGTYTVVAATYSTGQRTPFDLSIGGTVTTTAPPPAPPPAPPQAPPPVEPVPPSVTQVLLPPVVLAPAAPPPPAPPLSESEQTSSGSTTKDDGLAKSKKSVPRCG